MFLCDVVRNKFKFCICEGAWSNFKIINTVVTDDILNFYITPENGNRCLIFSQRRGEMLPKEVSPFVFTFKPLQHVKFESIGGDVVLVGNGFEGAISKKNMNNFKPNCSFADEDDWAFNQKQRTKEKEMTRKKNKSRDKFENRSETPTEDLGVDKLSLDEINSDDERVLTEIENLKQGINN